MRRTSIVVGVFTLACANAEEARPDGVHRGDGGPDGSEITPSDGGGFGGSSIVGIAVPDAMASDRAPVSDACAGSVTEAHPIPLDLFIMLDRSASMAMPVGPAGESRWSAVKTAMGSFVRQPEAAGIGLGLNYFGPSQDVVLLGRMCNRATYATADVPIAALPGNAQPILDSLARHQPDSTTPTWAALQGAVDFCRAWANAHPGHVVANVFATDGEPADCEVDPVRIQNIASDAQSGVPSIPTFVIGVGGEVTQDAGSGKRLLETIASAGGTGHPFLVSDADVTRQFLDALQRIRGAALGCVYEIPDTMGLVPDFGKVNVRFAADGGTSSLVPKVASPTACGDRDGWYYDDEVKPSRILVCPASCQAFSGAVHGGRVEIEVGCETIIAPPPR